MVCETCGVEFSGVRPNRIARGEGRFCSLPCFGASIRKVTDKQIVEAIAQGLTTAEIAERYQTTPGFIRTRLSRPDGIYDRTGMSNRVELMMWWFGSPRNRELISDLTQKKEAAPHAA